MGRTAVKMAVVVVVVLATFAANAGILNLMRAKGYSGGFQDNGSSSKGGSTAPKSIIQPPPPGSCVIPFELPCQLGS